ncbi:MAG: hypothetical protein IJU81_05260 [Bacteroidales bacterium]|nr:hypothetical protein [Bacteroidales bacterium]
MNYLKTLLIISIIPTTVFSQNCQSEIYKVFERHIEDCRGCSEKIVLYKDSSFHVYSCIGNISVQYNGGWWIKDSTLIIQPSLNCDGPKLLNKKEYKDTSTNKISIEIYTEKGKLLYNTQIDINDCSNNKHISGRINLKIKERLLYRYYTLSIKGRGMRPIRTYKENNRIELIIMEPSSSSDVYLGKQVIPLKSLVDKDATK